MRMEKVFINGKEQDIVTHLDNDYKDDTVMHDINLEDTIELSIDEIHNKLEDTMIINVNKDGSKNG